MEKRYYEYDYFFESIASRLTLLATGFESNVFKSGEEVWKIFRKGFSDRNEQNIEAIGKLNRDYLTTPIALFYLSGEYFGYVMDDAGDDLAKSILNRDLTRNEILDILGQVKEIIVYLHSLSLCHGDIKIDSILLKHSHVRLGDINNLTYPNAIPNLNVLHQDWYDIWGSYQLIDIFAFNYLTFLLLNYPISELREYIKCNMVFSSMRTLSDFTTDNKIVDKEVWGYVSSLLNGRIPTSKKSYLKPDMLLLDYLK